MKEESKLQASYLAVSMFLKYKAERVAIDDAQSFLFFAIDIFDIFSIVTQ